jgi:tetratricopeptide (TPR) repeat protein
MLGGKEVSTRVSAAYAVGQIGLALKEIEVTPLQDPLKSALEKVQPPESFLEGFKSQAASEEPAQADKAAAELKKEDEEQQAQVPENKDELRKVFLKHFSEGRLKQSLQLALEYLKKYPHDLMANFFVGNLYFQISKFEEATRYFEKTIELDPFHVQAISNLGITYYRCGKLHEAIEFFKKALHLKPELSSIRFNLASLYLKTNRWEEALRQFQEGLRYKKPTARILTNMAFAYQKTGNFEKAIESYKNAASLNPEDSGIYYNWAIILARTGSKLAAMQMISKALKVVPASSPGAKSLKDLLERLKS